MKMSLIIACIAGCLNMLAQNVELERRTNGQFFNPNGIPMIYVEGNGSGNGVYIGKYEVTQLAWKAVMGVNSSLRNATNDLPVAIVSWDDVQLFIQKLNELTGRNYRLPTEAEWEYAAKGGNLSKGYAYSGSNQIKDVAWYKKNSKKNIQKVGRKNPNELGIYDMSGNVSEWCDDCWGKDCSYRVIRGGSYIHDAKITRLATRSRQKANIVKNPHPYYYYIGFRLVLP